MDFYFRSVDEGKVLDVGVALGILIRHTDQNSGAVSIAPAEPERDMLILVGTVWQQDGIVRDPEGIPYQHVNVRIADADQRFGVSVPRDVAGLPIKSQWLTALAVSKLPNHIIEAALDDPTGMFIIGADGTPTDPIHPVRVIL